LAVAIAFKLGTYRGRDRKLVFRPLIEPALTRTICLVTHAERVVSPAASALIKATIDHLHRRTDGFRLQRRSAQENTVRSGASASPTAKPSSSSRPLNQRIDRCTITSNRT
jgi:hypothetical protein